MLNAHLIEKDAPIKKKSFAKKMYSEEGIVSYDLTFVRETKRPFTREY